MNTIYIISVQIKMMQIKKIAEIAMIAIIVIIMIIVKIVKNVIEKKKTSNSNPLKNQRINLIMLMQL